MMLGSLCVRLCMRACVIVCVFVLEVCVCVMNSLSGVSLCVQSN